MRNESVEEPQQNKIYYKIVDNKKNHNKNSFDEDRLTTQNKFNKSTTSYFNGSVVGGKFRTQSCFSQPSVISQNVSSVRLMGYSEYQSSNTLRNSSYVWSFSKSNRFKYNKPVTDTIYKLPDTKSEKYATQGIGGRKDLRPVPGNSSPPCNTYYIKTCFDENVGHKRGPSLYEKAHELVI
jgi:hypothetical protein